MAQEFAGALSAHPMSDPNALRNTGFWEQIVAQTNGVDEAIEKIRSQ
jgi:hypothetical protein